MPPPWNLVIFPTYYQQIQKVLSILYPRELVSLIQIGFTININSTIRGYTLITAVIRFWLHLLAPQ